LRATRRGEWPDKPENWLISIAHNECRQRFRRLGRRATEVPLNDDVAAGGSAVADTAETAEEIEGVLDALAELPFNQRAALVLREVSGRSAAEIAQFLGTSTAAVEMLVFRARQTIRTDLAGVRALALVPLPRSLLSLVGGSAKAGGLVGGLGGVAKVVAVVVAAGVATSGGSTKPERGAAAELPVVAERAVAVREPAPALASTVVSRQAPKASRAPATKQPGGSAPLARPEQPTVLAPSLPLVEAPPPALVPLPPVLSQRVTTPTLALPTVPSLSLPLELPAVGLPPAVTLPDPGTPSLP
jgi:RNA polymerase sigma factor (sigma-70 family)